MALHLQRQDAAVSWQQVVVTTGVGIPALVKQLQISQVNSKCLVRIAANKTTMADIVGPGRATVGHAIEGLSSVAACSIYSLSNLSVVKKWK